MGRKSGLLPEPCPVCGRLEGRIEDYKYFKKYEIKNKDKFDQASLIEKVQSPTNDNPNEEKQFFRLSNSYRQVKIVHPGLDKPCKLNPDDAVRFLGLKYKEQMKRLSLACATTKVFCGQIIDSLEACKALIRIGVPEIFVGVNIKYTDETLKEYKDAFELFSAYEKACTEGTITEKIDIGELDAFIQWVETQSQTMKMALRLTLTGGTKEEIRSLIDQTFRNAISVTSDEPYQTDLEFDEMLNGLKHDAENFGARRMELISRPRNASDISELMNKFSIDLTKLATDGQGSQDFEELFNTKPSPYLRQVIMMYSPSLLMAMKIIIKRMPERFGKPPVGIDDLSRLPNYWQEWYVLLSEMSRERKSHFDRRVKVLPSEYQVLEENERQFGKRAAGKKADISAKQVKRILDKDKGIS